MALCPASKPYDKGDADGQQGAGEPERDECLAPLRAVAHRIEDPDADAPRVERPNERGDDSKAQRAESRQPGEGAPKHTATCRFRAHGSMMRVAARPVNDNRVLVAHPPEDTPGIPRVDCDRCQLGDSIDFPLTRPRPRARVVQSSHRATGARAARRTGCLVAAVQRQHHGLWVGRLQVHVSVEDVPPPFGVVLLDGPLRRWWENADPRLPLPRRRPQAGRFHSRRRLDVDRGRASPKPEGNRA